MVEKLRQERLHLVQLAGDGIEHFDNAVAHDYRPEFLYSADEGAVTVSESLMACDE